MTVESIPKFTGPAAKLWATVPPDTKKLLPSNVWCVHCRHEVTITDFTGTVVGGDLLLQGLCSDSVNVKVLVVSFMQPTTEYGYRPDDAFDPVKSAN